MAATSDSDVRRSEHVGLTGLHLLGDKSSGEGFTAQCKATKPVRSSSASFSNAPTQMSLYGASIAGWNLLEHYYDSDTEVGSAHRADRGRRRAQSASGRRIFGLRLSPGSRGSSALHVGQSRLPYWRNPVRPAAVGEPEAAESMPPSLGTTMRQERRTDA